MNAAQLLINRFQDAKTLPHVSLRLGQLIANPHTPIKKFEEIISMDPALTMRLLRVVNSPYYGLHHRVENISRAVVFLGMKNLRNLVLTEAMRDIFSDKTDHETFSAGGLWLHSVATAICSRMIAERLFSRPGEDAYLAGLLHDVGMIVEAQLKPRPFFEACELLSRLGGNLPEHERSQLDTDHCQVGQTLGVAWHLSTVLTDAIGRHHDEKPTDPEDLASIIQISAFIVSRMGYPALPGKRTVLPPYLAAEVKANLDEYNVLARALPDELDAAVRLYALSA